MPRTSRTLRDAARKDVPKYVQACLDAVNTLATKVEVMPGRSIIITPRPTEWNLKLEMLRQWRDSEWKRTPGNRQKINTLSAAGNLMSRHRQIFDDCTSDPPHFERAAEWLIETGRAKDLYCCRECKRWHLAEDDRREVCSAADCQKAVKRKYQKAYRAI